MRTAFEPFPVGQVANLLPVDIEPPSKPSHRSVEVVYPSRLQAMSLDSSLITESNGSVYKAGHINFSVNVPWLIRLNLNPDIEGLSISERTERKPLVTHATKIMCEALQVDDAMEIDVVNEGEFRHCGLGSSSAIVAGVAVAINEAYGKPLSPGIMSRYCSQNHGEEIDNDNERLMPVQSLGGSAICGHFEGGLIVSAGESTPIYTHNLNRDLEVVFGMPEGFIASDAKEMMEAEMESVAGFRATGETYGPTIAYRLVHEVLPSLVEGDLKPCKDLIFDYRWDMGSNANCAFTHPALLDIAEGLRDLRDDARIDIISLSSVGPGFFALTKHPEYAEQRFAEQGMETYRMSIHNDTYKVSKS